MTPFAQRLRDAVQRAGVTQAWLAARYNAISGAAVGSPTISRWIAGDREPTLAAIEVLAVALDVRAAWLAFGDEPRERDADVPVVPTGMFETLDQAERRAAAPAPRGARKRTG